MFFLTEGAVSAAIRQRDILGRAAPKMEHVARNLFYLAFLIVLDLTASYRLPRGMLLLLLAVIWRAILHTIEHGIIQLDSLQFEEKFHPGEVYPRRAPLLSKFDIFCNHPVLETPLRRFSLKTILRCWQQALMKDIYHSINYILHMEGTFT